MHALRSLPEVYPGKQPFNRPELYAKVSSHVPLGDYQLITALAGHGVASRIIDHAIKSAADFIRANNLTPVVDNSKFLDYLRERSFVSFAVDGRERPSSQPPASPQGPSSPLGTGTSGSGTGVAHAPDVPASVGTDAATGAGRRGRKAGGGKGKTTKG